MLTDADITEFETQLKNAWSDFRALQGNPTIDIVPMSGSEVTSVDAAVFSQMSSKKIPYGTVSADEEFRTVVVYDQEINVTDRIRYRSNLYDIVSVAYNSKTSRSKALVKRTI